jgi:hypothetical protein
MNKPFNIIKLYRDLDMWKQKHHQQILYKHKIKFRYKKLMKDYKNLIVEYAKFRTENKIIRRTIDII